MLGQDDLLTQKVELLLEMNSKKVLAELTKLHQEIADVKSEIAELKKQRPSAAPAPSYTQPMGPPPRQEERSRAPEPPQNWQPRQEPQEPQTQQEPPQRDQNKPIDRNKVAPADVDIQNIFYFGNKKK